MLQKIRIKLKSYDHATLDQSASDIVRTARRTGAVTSGPVPLPTKKTVYTVLRSPHVDKKSREQFEIRIHKRRIDITRPSASTMEALENLDIPAGDVAQPLVDANLELLARLLVDVRAAKHGVD